MGWIATEYPTPWGTTIAYLSTCNANMKITYCGSGDADGNKIWQIAAVFSVYKNPTQRQETPWEIIEKRTIDTFASTTDLETFGLFGCIYNKVKEIFPNGYSD